MRRFVVDALLPDVLPNIPEPVVLCDAAGNVMGVYTPDLSNFEGLEPEMSEDELRRREHEPGGRPLAEVLADLEQRG